MESEKDNKESVNSATELGRAELILKLFGDLDHLKETKDFEKDQVEMDTIENAIVKEFLDMVNAVNNSNVKGEINPENSKLFCSSFVQSSFDEDGKLNGDMNFFYPEDIPMLSVKFEHGEMIPIYGTSIIAVFFDGKGNFFDGLCAETELLAEEINDAKGEKKFPLSGSILSACFQEKLIWSNIFPLIAVIAQNSKSSRHTELESLNIGLLQLADYRRKFGNLEGEFKIFFPRKCICTDAEGKKENEIGVGHALLETTFSEGNFSSPVIIYGPSGTVLAKFEYPMKNKSFPYSKK